MKQLNIGVDMAEVYVAWADLETREGKDEKATSILQRALERSKVDQGPINAALTKLRGGAAPELDETVAIGKKPATPAAPVAADETVSIGKSASHALVSATDDTVAMGRQSHVKVAQQAALGDIVVRPSSKAASVPTAPASAKSALAPARPAPSRAEADADGSTGTIVFSGSKRAAGGTKPRGVGFAPKSLGLGKKFGRASRATTEDDDESVAPAADAPPPAASALAPVAHAEAPAAEMDDTVMRPDLQLQQQQQLGAIAEDEGISGRWSSVSERSSRSSTSATSADGTIRLNQEASSKRHSSFAPPATPTAPSAAMATPVRPCHLPPERTPQPAAMAAAQTPTVHSSRQNAVPQTPLSATKPLPSMHAPPAAHTPSITAATNAHAYAAATTPAASAAGPSAGAAPPTASAFRGSSEVRVNGVSYSVLELMGKGGTSQVYRVLSPEGEVLALKQVKLDAEGADEGAQLLQAVRNEIELMVRLRESGLNKFIIRLVDAEINEAAQIVYMVMECGEIDLAGMLRRHWAEAAERDPEGGGAANNDNFVCMYWEQILKSVHAIHEARVIHGDLKPANFLCVRGALKLIDFGIAKTMANPDNTKIARENTVGTVNYMSPEAIMGDDDGQHKQGRASDVWSLGCILYQMCHGHTPFSHLKNLIQKMQAITNDAVSISFPPLRNPHMHDVIKACLQRDPTRRPSIPELLNHPLLRAPPAPAPAPTAPTAGVGLSAEELGQLMQQVAAASAAGDSLSIESLLAQITQRQQGGASAQPFDVRTLVSSAVVNGGELGTPRAERPARAPTGMSTPAAAAPSPFALSRRREMPGSCTRTMLPAPPPSLSTLAPPPPAPPPVPPPPPAPSAAAPPPLARASSSLSSFSAADLQGVRLKKAPFTATVAPPAAAPAARFGDDLLRKAMASRRQAAGEDDTVDVTDAFS